MHFIYLYFSHLFLSLPIYLFQNKNIWTKHCSITFCYDAISPIDRSITHLCHSMGNWNSCFSLQHQQNNPHRTALVKTKTTKPNFTARHNNPSYLPANANRLKSKSNVPSKTTSRANQNQKSERKCKNQPHTKKNNINLAARCTLRSRYAPNNTLGIRQE